MADRHASSWRHRATRFLRRNPVIVDVALGLLGLVLILWSSKEKGSWQTGLFGLGLALVAAAAVTLIQDVFGTDVATTIERRMGIDRLLSETGLDQIALPPYNAIKTFERFSHSSSVDMLYNTGMTTIHQYGTFIAEAVATRGCEVRFIVSNPENAFWQDQNLTAGLCPGLNVGSEVENAIDLLKGSLNEARTRHPNGKCGRVVIRKMVCVPSLILVIIDKSHALVTPYVPYLHSGAVPAMEISDDRGKLFNFYQQTFERVWKRASNEEIWDSSVAEYLEARNDLTLATHSPATTILDSNSTDSQ